MDQLICASLSHTRYWYEVGMLKVPAVHTHVSSDVLVTSVIDPPLADNDTTRGQDRVARVMCNNFINTHTYR